MADGETWLAGTVQPEQPPAEQKPEPEAEKKKISVCVYRFPYGFQEHSTTVNWLMNALFTLHNHPAVHTVCTEVINDTPVDMSRNRAIRHALDNKIDYAIFIDSDMFPDYLLQQKTPDTKAIAFLPAALDFALELGKPCVVGAPYCSSPPEEMVLVMRWRQRETDCPDGECKLDKYTREETIGLEGFEEVAGLGTGLLLIDLKAVAEIPAPWFSYQWKDKEHTWKASTEDVVFTRDLSLAGVPQYCFWSAWAGHWKPKMVSRPTGLPVSAVPLRMQKAVETAMNRKFNEQYGHLLKGK